MVLRMREVWTGKEEEEKLVTRGERHIVSVEDRAGQLLDYRGNNRR
jgi:hypothetical protein